MAASGVSVGLLLLISVIFPPLSVPGVLGPWLRPGGTPRLVDSAKRPPAGSSGNAPTPPVDDFPRCTPRASLGRRSKLNPRNGKGFMSHPGNPYRRQPPKSDDHDVMIKRFLFVMMPPLRAP